MYHRAGEKKTGPVASTDTTASLQHRTAGTKNTNHPKAQTSQARNLFRPQWPRDTSSQLNCRKSSLTGFYTWLLLPYILHGMRGPVNSTVPTSPHESPTSVADATWHLRNECAQSCVPPSPIMASLASLPEEVMPGRWLRFAFQADPYVVQKKPLTKP